ncbi:MAG TPA: hypothetical protein VFW27_33790 [Actinoplanes sp.]|nr:hypothetical protein [Actinoplanes sp.]
MKRAGLIFSLLSAAVASASSAADCYYGEVGAAKLTDGGTVLEVDAYFPCSNGDQEDVPFWVEDKRDGKIGIAIEIPGATCEIGRRFPKKLRYNLKAYNLHLPSYAFKGDVLKPLTFEEYASATQSAGEQTCTKTESIGYGATR